MRSTLGRRAAICKNLGFTLEFVEHGISYAKLQMMLMDMPRVIKKDKEKVALTEDNEDSFVSMLLSRGAVLKQ